MRGMDDLSEDEVRDLLEQDGDGDVVVGRDEGEYVFEPW